MAQAKRVQSEIQKLRSVLNFWLSSMTTTLGSRLFASSDTCGGEGVGASALGIPGVVARGLELQVTHHGGNATLRSPRSRWPS